MRNENNSLPSGYPCNFALIKVLTLDILSSKTNINYSKAVDCAQATQCSYYFGINEEQNTESS